MSEKQAADKQAADALRVEAAFWEVPGAGWKIVYSLPLFHEIDFVVNEGYRKIPHGGIEEGGVLFGAVRDGSLWIEAFRPIVCEHSSGPSLNLSERDLAALGEQLAEFKADRELEKLEPVGWFLAHTRGPLEMTEAEVKSFNRFFPGPKRVTVLVKPERFQPTRFGFLTRDAKGEVSRDAANSAVILPLPGRSHKSGELVPSISAPRPLASAKIAAQRVMEEEIQEEEAPEIPPPPPPALRRQRRNEMPAAGPTLRAPDPEPLSIWKIPPDADLTESEAEEPLENLEPALDQRTQEDREARKQLSRDRARVIEEAFVTPAHPPAFRPTPLPSLPANLAGTTYLNSSSASQRAVTDAPRQESMMNVRSITALVMAGLLGCLVGYIAYLQLPSPVISLDVKPVDSAMLVSWPPEETRNSIYAAIRLNDGPAVPLSADEKKTGRVSLTPSKDFKVEVMARNWIRDSRGIVRYVHTANANGKVLPSETTALP